MPTQRRLGPRIRRTVSKQTYPNGGNASKRINENGHTMKKAMWPTSNI